jgi:hypothetical protein
VGGALTSSVNPSSSFQDIRRNSFASHQKNQSEQRPYQERAQKYLKKLENKRIQSAVAVQKVEEILLELLKEENVPSDGPLALDLLNAAIKNANISKERIIVRIFSLACQVMVCSGHPLALKEIQRQTWRLLNGHRHFMTKDPIYNTHHVNDACCQYIILALNNSHRKWRLDYETSQQIDRLIRRMRTLYQDPSVTLTISPEACNAFIMFYCKLGKPTEALTQLQWMINKGHQVPKLSSFSLTISAFANAADPEKALEIIQWMLSSYSSSESRISPPNRTCFNGLLNAYAKSGRRDAGEKAEQTIEWMQQLHETENIDTQPDEISFASCINAWARSPRRDAPIRAEAILDRVINFHKNGTGVQPTLSAFCSVMDAWARSDRGNATAKVEELLNVVEDLDASMENFELSAIPYTILIKTWENAARRSTGKSSTMACGDKALQILSRMQSMGITPPPATYNAIIMAINETSAINAVFFFLELEEMYRYGLIQLDTRTFNCGLNAIASMNKPDGAEKAMNVLQRMSEYSKSDSYVRPDETTFNVILKVLSRDHSKNAALKADNLLQEMIMISSVKPSFISYLTCIVAWGRSGDPDKFQRVRNLLDGFEANHRKKKLAGKLSISVYNAVLSVCHHNKSPELEQQALDTALFTMKKVRGTKKVHPDKTTYESLFRVFSMIPKSAAWDAFLETEFSLCIEDGLVTPEIVELVQKASTDVLHKLIGSEDPVSIPEKWSRRVHTPR